MKRIAVHVTEDQLKLLRALSETTGLAKAELLRRALDTYLMEMKAIHNVQVKKKSRRA